VGWNINGDTKWYGKKYCIKIGGREKKKVDKI